jgi:uncharacterized protein YecE (DUF72 family)
VHARAPHDRGPGAAPACGWRRREGQVTALFVGTSGWAYKEWRGGFYPPELPQSRFLEHYSRTLGACEVNATFYRLQSETTFARWRQSVPESFRLAVKAHRGICHRKSFAPRADRNDLLWRFLASLEPLGEQLSCTLLQFPPFVERDDAALGSLLAALPLPAACEFHHPSWEEPRVRQSVAEQGGTICVLETEGSVPERLPAGPIAYVRMKATRYDEQARASWLDLLRREAEERDIYVFTKHEGVPAGDPFAGVGLAQWLAERSGASADGAKLNAPSALP